MPAPVSSARPDAQRSAGWSTSRRDSLPSDWTARAAAVARYADWTCAACGIDTREHHVRGECDHVGDRTDHRLRSLRHLCSRCHAARTQAQAQAARTGARVCQHCPVEIPPRSGRGRPAAFCSPACRRAAATAQDRSERRAAAELVTALDAARIAEIPPADLGTDGHILDRAYRAHRAMSARAPLALDAAQQRAEITQQAVQDHANASRSDAMRRYWSTRSW